MIVKIMAAAGPNFPGVNYNEKKIDKGKGELVLIKNFPSFINESSTKEQVRDYLRAVSIGNKKIAKPQFHAVISTRFQAHSKEELTVIAENFMIEMGYGEQPLLAVFHHDTDHNHVHIISTRVDRKSGKKINDSYERLKAQKALSSVLEQTSAAKPEEVLDRLLKYKISTPRQLETLLERNGYTLVKKRNNENAVDILKNGVKLKTIEGNRIAPVSKRIDPRKNQLKAILIKYKDIHSNKVFEVRDNRKQKSTLPREKVNEKMTSQTRIAFESELQKKLRDIFGIDIVFHHKDDLKPFGYTLIDHKTQTVYKGSEVLELKELFEFTPALIDKKLFEVLKEYNIPHQKSKDLLIKFFKSRNPETRIEEFMLFENRGKKDLETYRKVQREVRDLIRNPRRMKFSNENISFLKDADGKTYAVHTRYHYIGELQSLIGEKELQRQWNSNPESSEAEKMTRKNEVKDALEELLSEFMKTSTAAKDPAENELKRKRKRRK